MQKYIYTISIMQKYTFRRLVANSSSAEVNLPGFNQHITGSTNTCSRVTRNDANGNGNRTGNGNTSVCMFIMPLNMATPNHSNGPLDRLLGSWIHLHCRHEMPHPCSVRQKLIQKCISSLLCMHTRGKVLCQECIWAPALAHWIVNCPYLVGTVMDFHTMNLLS